MTNTAVISFVHALFFTIERRAIEFGLGKFLEMFEAQFGRRPTVALLVTIIIGIVSICITALLAALGSIYTAVDVLIAGEGFSAENIARTTLQMVFFIGFGYLISKVLLHFIWRKYQTKLDKANAELKKNKVHIDEGLIRLDAMASILDARLERLHDNPPITDRSSSSTE